MKTSILNNKIGFNLAAVCQFILTELDPFNVEYCRNKPPNIETDSQPSLAHHTRYTHSLDRNYCCPGPFFSRTAEWVILLQECHQRSAMKFYGCMTTGSTFMIKPLVHGQSNANQSITRTLTTEITDLRKRPLGCDKNSSDRISRLRKFALFRH